MTRLLLRLVRANHDIRNSVPRPVARRPIARWVRASDGSLHCLWDDRMVARSTHEPA